MTHPELVAFAAVNSKLQGPLGALARAFLLYASLRDSVVKLTTITTEHGYQAENGNEFSAAAIDDAYERVLMRSDAIELLVPFKAEDGF